MFSKLIADVQSYFRARAAENALADLSDADLDDIGLTRADIATLFARPKPERAAPAPARDLSLAGLPVQLNARAA